MSAEPNDFDLARLDEIPDPIGTRSVGSKADESSAEALRAKLLADVPAATRRQVRRQRLIAISVSLVWLAGLLFAVGFQRQVDDARTAFFGQVLLPATLGFIAMYVSLASGRLGLGPRFSVLAGLTLAGPLLFAAMVLASSTSLVAGESTMVKHAVACCAVALVVSSVPMLAAMVAMRRANVTNGPWRSALVGVGVGLVSAAVLGMHCSSTDAAHVLFGHVTPVIVLGLAALFAVRRFARVD